MTASTALARQFSSVCIASCQLDGSLFVHTCIYSINMVICYSDIYIVLAWPLLSRLFFIRQNCRCILFCLPKEFYQMGGGSCHNLLWPTEILINDASCILLLAEHKSWIVLNGNLCVCVRERERERERESVCVSVRERVCVRESVCVFLNAMADKLE